MGALEKVRLLIILGGMRQIRIQLTPIVRLGAFLIAVLVLPAWGNGVWAQDRTDWRKLERLLPSTVVVEPDFPGFGYRFETAGYPIQVPEEFLTGGSAAKNALRSAMAGRRVDSLVALVLLAQLKDRQAAAALTAILIDPQKLGRYAEPTQAAIPLVVRYHLPDNEWPEVLITALGNSPTGADSSIVACLTRFDFPAAGAVYRRALPNLDPVSQQRVIGRLAHNAPDDRVLWELFGLSGRSDVQNSILDQLEQMKSSRWPAQADSLARVAVGNAACRVLRHASATDTAVYRPLMRTIVVSATDTNCVIDAELRLSAEGDAGALEVLKYRYDESNPEFRVVSALAICRLGDTWGVGACIRLGLKHPRYRAEVIKALEKVTGLAYGGDDEKWNEWLKNWKQH